MKIKNSLKKLGPGLISGAADDDPSGIATYSIAGAQYGYNFLWPAFLTIPLMITVQEMAARIALVTKKDLTQVFSTHFPRPLVIVVSLFLFCANTLNIGADIAGMSSALELIIPLPGIVLALTLTMIITVSLIFLPYKKIAGIFKWLTIALFSYVLAFLFTKPDVGQILKQTFLPELQFNKQYLLTLLAFFGTTISPYVMFWQASEENEEERLLKGKFMLKSLVKSEHQDTIIGMLFSNLATFFIVAATGATLFQAGIHEITTASQAASALKPLAGDLASLLFAIGIVGTGILAIPVLAGSAAYALSETFKGRFGLDKSFRQAPLFYGVIICSTFIGMIVTTMNINPFKLLFYSAVGNGLLTPVIIALLLIIANRKSLMGQYKNTLTSNLLSLITLVIMSLCAIFIFI